MEEQEENQEPDGEGRKRKRHSEDEKSFARRARPTSEDSLNQWLAIRDAYRAHLEVRFGASHQELVYLSAFVKPITSFRV